MIPTMLLVGLAMGLMVHDERTLWVGAAVGAVTALLWGLVVSVTGDGNGLATFVGGTALGLANVLVACAAGAAIRRGVAALMATHSK